MMDRARELIRAVVALFRQEPTEDVRAMFPFDVLLYEEDGEMVARALELDICSVAKDSKTAVNQLVELVTAQIRFAAQQGKPEMLNFPADEKYFEMFRQAKRLQLNELVTSSKREASSARAETVFVPRPEIAGAAHAKVLEL